MRNTEGVSFWMEYVADAKATPHPMTNSCVAHLYETLAFLWGRQDGNVSREQPDGSAEDGILGEQRSGRTFNQGHKNACHSKRCIIVPEPFAGLRTMKLLRHNLTACVDHRQHYSEEEVTQVEYVHGGDKGHVDEDRCEHQHSNGHDRVSWIGGIRLRRQRGPDRGSDAAHDENQTDL